MGELEELPARDNVETTPEPERGVRCTRLPVRGQPGEEMEEVGKAAKARVFWGSAAATSTRVCKSNKS